MQPVQAVVFVRFARDDYETFRSALANRQWHATFDAWEADHTQSIQEARNKGRVALEEEVRSAPFLAWCKANNQPLNAESLTEYAVALARLRIHADP